MERIWCEKLKLFVKEENCTKMLCKYYVANGGVCFSKPVEVHTFA
ncbi:hypothetical protein Ferp_2500 [Ferroglobus placidus DSM 10642]|uniref:Uncharacterized protein n=1 Tax=Ferroglobus placidus (strain DSM 10642 / AEDII12DO) TaxID=589924 RepID=D3S2B6_FERPA|nr:hypothetical protein [Ferroglobus placidus]ADC66607.1 hypothetical protein Ferp_2500 [Ferroglobus placidus DSM 10642]